MWMQKACIAKLMSQPWAETGRKEETERLRPEHEWPAWKMISEAQMEPLVK
jgi:hypothetical protein